VAAGVVTTPLANFGSHRGVTVTAGCTGGARLVGGGGYLRAVSDPAILPTNGLVLGAVTPAGTTYFYRVVATNSVGTTSARSRASRRSGARRRSR
jgi:hypothetical protein